MLGLGELGEMSFRILELGELGKTSFGMLELGAANFGILYQKGFCTPKGF